MAERDELGYPAELFQYFLRILCHKNLLKKKEVPEMAQQIVDDLQEHAAEFPFHGAVPNFLEEFDKLGIFLRHCDEELSKLGLKLVKTSSDLTGERYYIVSPIMSLDQDIKGTELFRPEAKDFFVKLLDAMFSHENTSQSLRTPEALDIAPRAGLKSRAEGDKALQSFIDLFYFESLSGVVYPGPRLKAEYGALLSRRYPRVMGRCGLCQKPTFCNRIRCSSEACGQYHHVSCLKHMIESRQTDGGTGDMSLKCEKCSLDLKIDDELN